MGRSGFAEGQIMFWLCIPVGSILFLWFCWPAVFKGIINVGNVCGMAGSAMLVCYGLHHRAMHWLLSHFWQKTPGRICLGLLLVCVAAGIALMAAAVVVILRAPSKSIPQNCPAVVLGCSVIGKRPSTILQERIDAAYVYLQEHPQAICVLSGGQGADEDISEAACMYQSLIAMGIDAGRLYQEDASTNTRENLENSKAVLKRLGISGALTVISSEFHLYRGRKWAQEPGWESYGYAAHTDWRYLPTFFLREVIAVVHLWIS